MLLLYGMCHLKKKKRSKGNAGPCCSLSVRGLRVLSCETMGESLKPLCLVHLHSKITTAYQFDKAVA